MHSPNDLFSTSKYSVMISRMYVFFALLHHYCCLHSLSLNALYCAIVLSATVHYSLYKYIQTVETAIWIRKNPSLNSHKMSVVNPGPHRQFCQSVNSAILVSVVKYGKVLSPGACFIYAVQTSGVTAVIIINSKFSSLFHMAEDFLRNMITK